MLKDCLSEKQSFSFLGKIAEDAVYEDFNQWYRKSGYLYQYQVMLPMQRKRDGMFAGVSDEPMIEAFYMKARYFWKVPL